MAYQEEEQLRLKRQSSKQAVDLAMEGRWQEAVEVNRKIVDQFPNDVETFNRLGRAYLELAIYPEAIAAYTRAKEIDPYNVIAEKNLHRLEVLSKERTAAGPVIHRVQPQDFLEEIGKAGVINLTRLAPKGVLARIVAGDQLCLRIDGMNLWVENCGGEVLGMVDIPTSKRLIKLMKGGNKYSATVISSNEEKLVVIIRETFQHPSQMGIPSFSSRGISKSSVSTEPDESDKEEGGYEIEVDETELMAEEAEAESQTYTDDENEGDLEV
ncbi:hypothetical protein CY91_00375 [Dehalococcoides mccartyi]|uniref:tetratricopeptide repeat protein n=1 Tax=Dehalococcoides mccartyi TaxID=61435 RepID=UPI00071E1106|nr:tetratricopeptide repeat protein [Dehalococcoides mccartyi]KSV18198.1 hypothetical protein CY91_00375 [Dehalococcoides mccartyi]